VSDAPTRAPAAGVHGRCAPAFAEVREELERNLGERGIAGAAVCVTLAGETVVDLWGGWQDAAAGAPWSEHTTILAWSCTKGLTATLAHMLASAGELDLDAPVARYWPAFAAEGKDAITVRMLLAHQAALPGVRGPLAPRAIYDWDAMRTALERERPFWRPGNGMLCYHAATFGWLVGEVIWRVSGLSPGQLLARELAGPLEAEVWIGLPAEQDHSVARLSAPPTYRFDYADRQHEPAGLRRTALQALERTLGDLFEPGVCDSRAARSVEMPAINGVASARGLARVYRPLALDGSFGGVRVVDERQLDAMAQVHAAACEEFVSLAPARYSAGFQKAAMPRCSPEGKSGGLVMAETAFGHRGQGGSLAFADPAAQLSFAYVTSTHSDAPAQYQRLVDAAYRAIGARRAADGATWRR
jgi:CubicO group peptidase (beta-lactamase class C family)